MPLNRIYRFVARGTIYLVVLAQLAFFTLLLSSFFGHNLLPSRKAQHSSSIQIGISNIQTLRNDGLTLRHVLHHGVGRPGPRARRLDITVDKAVLALSLGQFGPFPIKTTAIPIDTPVNQEHIDKHTSPNFWTRQLTVGPNVTDKQTIVNLARMSEDAYKPDPSDPEWLDVGDKYNNSIPFGWDESGIRGHVFSDSLNKTIILAVKGTSVAMFEGNGTSGHDKDNDNLFGSCCCGQGGPYLWHQACDCKTGTYTCDGKCVKDELRKPNKYFQATLDFFEEVAQLYPQANIIATGHSLGGVLASLIALRQNIAAVTFETYPQALAASRLGLTVPGKPSGKETGIFNFGHTADPIYMGTCNGASSFCSIAGYAFETICHAGRKCVYDVVKDYGWRQSTNYHRLRYSIENVYEKYDEAAPCQEEDLGCEDCYVWKFENGTHTKPATTTTTTSSTTSRTRTETCKTPGWWGCRDETTTTYSTTSTSGISTTTMTTTTTATTVIMTTSLTSTSTCKTPGWFGCKDKTTTTAPTTTSDATTTTCTSKGWFGRCLDETYATTPAAEVKAYSRILSPTAIQTVS
ncbi:autophagy related lipase-like protein Atg15 [Dendryphion nanum]|uniref:triacylglycerol lipase n=1 Tax=Dendryphion nanum TaxID=256645 RepID=A0A9P9ILE3_9PLEO|nr:autophagy related lipase-like protein Atg15 [Dendryphion nanum]